MFFDYIGIIFGIVKIYVLKIVYSKRIFLNGKIKINSNFHMSLKKETKLYIGKNFKARNYLNIRNDFNGVIEIGNNVFFNDGVSINCQNKILIGNNVSIGHNVLIIDHDHDYKNDMKKFVTKEITIGNNVWIGANSIILKGCVIPDNCVIAAGTVLNEKSCYNLDKDMLIYNKKEIKSKEKEK